MAALTDYSDQQESLCRKYNAAYLESDPGMIVGVADNIKDKLPLDGLRHQPTETTTGWYIWAGGEPSTNTRFFKPMHLKHLLDLHPELIPYLGLAPGWRFLVDPTNGYEDVWRDDSLLDDASE